MATRKMLNKIVYNFTPNRALNLICPSSKKSNFLITRASIKDIITFTNTNIKCYYNRHHHLIFLKIGEWALIYLYKGYLILSIIKITTKLI